MVGIPIMYLAVYSEAPLASSLMMSLILKIRLSCWSVGVDARFNRACVDIKNGHFGGAMGLLG